MRHLRQIVASQMMARHGIPSELARYHVERMDAEELWWRFRYYKKHAGMELSVAGPKSRAVNESSTRFSRPQRRRQADGTQPCFREVLGDAIERPDSHVCADSMYPLLSEVREPAAKSAETGR